MNGAESLLKTLVHCGVDVCFTNPGTTEMQFLAALDRVAGLRCVPTLFEGVASGAADGYARMRDKPAATLLHLGPGLANALANLHNARRAQVPLVNIIGEHASYHRQYDPPLHSDIAGMAGTVSAWVHTIASAGEIPALTQAAVAASREAPGQVATLIVPMDHTWADAPAPIASPLAVPAPRQVSEASIDRAARMLRAGKPTALILKGSLLHGQSLALADQIRSQTGARVLCDTFNARIERGAGRPAIEYLPYFPEMIATALAGFEQLILVGAKTPAGFFAYRHVPESLLASGCAVHTLCTPEEDGADALQRLAAATGALARQPLLQQRRPSPMPAGTLDAQAIALAVASLLPENAIVIDEAITSSMPLAPATAGAPPHDWLFNTGGAIGQGLPLAAGAAIACPDRKVLCLAADGSSLYTLQSLWTFARESLDITTVIYANRAYGILDVEYQRLGAGAPSPRVRDLISLQRPDIDWVRLAGGMGVPAVRVTTMEEFNRYLWAYLKEPGPNLIEAVI